MKVVVAGATGYIGAPLARELVARGHHVVCLARRRAGVRGALTEEKITRNLEGAEVLFTDVTSNEELATTLRRRSFDAVFSCLASRTGAPRDAWLVDHDANVNLLEAAKAVGAAHFVLLSAICVQKPLLEFQRAKLAFEKKLRESGLTWSIVRPTAFFKSLSGQVEAVKRGKPFTVVGDGELTACKPISHPR